MTTTILLGNCLDVLQTIPDNSINCCVTSPPYWGLRDYGTGTWIGGSADCQHIVGNQISDTKYTGAINTDVRPGCDAFKCRLCGATRKDDQIGLEPTSHDYITKLVLVFREVRRVLTPDGTLWLNLGDSYAGSGKGRNADGSRGAGSGKQVTNKGSIEGLLLKATPHGSLKRKDLAGIPWRVALALQDDGWYLRSDIIWNKPNVMPERVRDRPTKSHEYIFLLTKNATYYYDSLAIEESTKHIGPNGETTKNARTVWNVNTKPYKGAHFATMPPEIVRRCILAGSPVGGMILDPFGGSGTTGAVATEMGRHATLIELNPKYIEMCNERLLFTAVIAPTDDWF